MRKGQLPTKGWGCTHPEYGHVRLVRVYPTDDYDDDGNAFDERKVDASKTVLSAKHEVQQH